MNTVVTSLPSHPASAPGAALRHWFAGAGATLWRALEIAGQARARRHLLDFADGCEALQPELAKQLRAAARQGPLA
jgi:hypothetical protein